MIDARRTGRCTRGVAVLTAVILVSACRPSAQPSGAPPATASADSIVLERTACFGTCPAYRLSLTGTGRATFLSRNAGDSTRVDDDAAAPGAVAVLADRAVRLGFDTIPAELRDDRTLCPPPTRSDAPTAVITLYRTTAPVQHAVHRVADYHGCQSGSPILAELRGLELAIDSAARSARWVRPGNRR